MGRDLTEGEAGKIDRARERALRVAGVVGPGALLAVPYGLFFAWGTAGYGSPWDIDPAQALQFWFVSITPCALLLRLRSPGAPSVRFYGGLAALLLSVVKMALLLMAPILVDAQVIMACQELDKVAAPLGTALLAAFLALPAVALAYLAVEGARIAYLSRRASRG